MNERKKIITLRWIWTAVFVLLLAMWAVAGFSGIAEYLAPPDEDISAADNYWISYAMCLVFVFPILALVAVMGIITAFLLKSGVYSYHGYEICVYAGYSESHVKLSGEFRDGSYVKLNGEFKDGSYLFLWKKGLFSAPQARSFTLGNGEEITVHILRTNRIAVQTPNGYIGKVAQ